MPTKPDIKTKYSVQEIENQSFDTDFGIKTFEGLGYDGVNLQRMPAEALATKVTTATPLTYIGLAAPGTDQATAKWQAFLVDTTSGVVVKYADGDSNFDNVVTDLTALTYT